MQPGKAKCVRVCVCVCVCAYVSVCVELSAVASVLACWVHTLIFREMEGVSLTATWSLWIYVCLGFLGFFFFGGGVYFQLKSQSVPGLNWLVKSTINCPLNPRYFDSHRYCRYTPQAQVCEPKEDGISSLRNLLQHVVHRVSIWVIALLTIAGNMLVIICRIFWREESDIHAFFIKNLCGK